MYVRLYMFGFVNHDISYEKKTKEAILAFICSIRDIKDFELKFKKLPKSSN